LVNECLDFLGPIEVNESTYRELVEQARGEGDLGWDSEENARAAERRVSRTLALVAASREFQFA
jgi:hypothetical protein